MPQVNCHKGGVCRAKQLSLVSIAYIGTKRLQTELSLPFSLRVFLVPVVVLLVKSSS
jgi:hypothetical protein